MSGFRRATCHKRVTEAKQLCLCQPTALELELACSATGAGAGAGFEGAAGTKSSPLRRPAFSQEEEQQEGQEE